MGYGAALQYPVRPLEVLTILRSVASTPISCLISSAVLGVPVRTTETATSWAILHGLGSPINAAGAAPTLAA
ncbi:hypothetical protein MSIMFB_00969 [Mycobacterium simulans]|uniref:Uncharacterized protein n=1 Tax=Mycobacterium simulans TaxID=627089 RepID=A0A7Z7IJF1_9MYCO|nr:hypothetical protein [Mycobacterium simulans]SOJ53466.1 hypothetical protein MSIMFB_00969 [Mycobacterium simulans]